MARVGVLVILSSLLVPCAALLAQEMHEQVQVDLVEVYLSAIGKDKKPAEDLTAADFEVREDNSPRQITNFSQLLAQDSEVMLSVIYLMDTSGSMAGGDEATSRVDVAKRFAEMTLKEMKPTDRLQVSAFDVRYKPLTQMTSDMSVIEQALDEIEIKGNPGTGLLWAVMQSAEQLKDQWGRKIIVICSDGETNVKDRAHLDEVIQALTRYDVMVLSLGTTDIRDWDTTRKNPRAPRSTSGKGNAPGALYQGLQSPYQPKSDSGSRGGDLFVRSNIDSQARNQARFVLKRLAEETGGFVFFPDKQQELSQALESLRVVLRSQYVLGFSPAKGNKQQASGKQWHKIKVDCRRDGVKIQYRKGYYSGD